MDEVPDLSRLLGAELPPILKDPGSPAGLASIGLVIVFCVLGIYASAKAQGALRMVLHAKGRGGAWRFLGTFAIWVGLGIWTPGLPLSVSLGVMGATFVALKGRLEMEAALSLAGWAAITLATNGFASAAFWM